MGAAEAKLKRARGLAKTPADKKRVAQHARELEWTRICQDPWYFISNFCWTLDEHDTANPYKKLPNKEYVRLSVEVWFENERLLVPKSRQIMISWMMVLCHLWLGITRRGQLIFFQSKKEEDADKLIDRAWGVYQRLPEWVRKRVPAVHSKCNLKFPGIDSKIQGIPEGEDQIRSNTASAIFSDESAFQPEFLSAFAAAMPAVEGGGRFTAASSAKLSPFFELCEEDVKPGTFKELVKGWEKRPKWCHETGGMHFWKNEMDWGVLEIHYSADPDKDEAWAQQAAKKQAGGIEGEKWQGEMEIDVMAKAGRRVLPQFSRATHVINSFTIPEEWPRFRGIDPGYNNPCAVVWVAQDGDGTFYVYDLFYEREHTVEKVASAVKARTGRQRFEFTKIGHDANARSQTNEGKTISEQYADHGIFTDISYVKNEDAVPYMSDLFTVRENGEPQVKVFDTTNIQPLIWELERWRFPDLTEQQKLTQNEKEKPLSKDDHAIHALRNVICNVGEDYIRQHGLKDPMEDLKVQSLSQQMRQKVIRGPNSGPDLNFYWEDDAL